jgi:hypothetical protein
VLQKVSDLTWLFGAAAADMSQRPQQLMRPLLVINIVSATAADNPQPANCVVLSGSWPGLLFHA